MTRILSLDLGVTTGWALLDSETEEILEHGIVGLEDLANQLTHLDAVSGARHVVIEKPIPTRGQLGEELHYAIRTAEEAFVEIVFIPPSAWKPHPVAKTPLPDLRTPHERDAARLGLFFIRTKLHLQGSE